MLSTAELSRYARQVALPEVGLGGQERLRNARVLVVGAGGLGSPAALYLAAAGVGTIGLLDDDTVELSNLHRQVLHVTSDVGRSKATSGVEALRQLNDAITVKEHRTRLHAGNAAGLMGDYQVVVDGSDNYPTRYAVNDACAALGIPWVYGSVERFAGQVSLFDATNGPCYRCLFPEPPAPGTTASCEEIGVLGAVPGVIGCLQAMEALKWIVGAGTPLTGRLLQIDLLTSQMHEVAFGRRDGCPACSDTAVSRTAAGNGTPADIAPLELAARLESEIAVRLLDIREPWEVAIAAIARHEHIPMNALPSVLDSLSREEELVVYCHHGVRSAMAADWLRRQGFNARNLAGGIDRWSREVDPAVPRY